MFRRKEKKLEKKKKQLMETFNLAFQDMRDKNLYKVTLNVEKMTNNNSGGGWISNEKFGYFPKEACLPEEQKLIDKKNNYSGNFLLRKIEDGIEEIGVAYIERQQQHFMTILEPNPRYVTSMTVVENLDEVANQLADQIPDVKIFTKEIREAILKTNDFHKERYQNNLFDKPSYETSKKIIEERNAPADEAIFTDIRSKLI